MIPKTFDPASGDLLTPGNYKDILSDLIAATKSSRGEFKLNGKLLDIGSNTTWLAQFADDYHGIDVDENLVLNAQKYWVGRGRWTSDEAAERISVSRTITLPFADATFDVVFMRDVLEHVQESRQFFSEASRVLKPGGIMYVSCPDSQRHVWDEPSHIRPYPVAAQIYLGYVHGLKLISGGYESVIPGTQKIARVFGGRTPWFVRVFWSLWCWPRNAVTIQQKAK